MIQIMIYGIEILILVSAVLATIVVLLAGLYDILTISRRAKVQAVMRKLRFPRQPRVVVLVYALGSVGQIEACLESVVKNTYRNFEVVLVNNRSSSGLVRTTRHFIETHPHVPVTLFSTRSRVTRAIALQRGYKKVSPADFVLVITSDDILSRSVVKQAVAQQRVNPCLTGIRLNNSSVSSLDFRAVITSFLDSSTHLFAKSWPLQRTPMWMSNFAVLVTHRTFLTRREIPHTLIHFTQYLAVCTYVLIVGFCLFLAATHHTSSLLLFSWLLVSFWLIVAVGSSDYSLADKRRLLYVVPSGYFLLLLCLIPARLRMSRSL